MASLTEHIAKAFRPPSASSTDANPQHVAARLAGEKRAMERRLRAQGLTRNEAKTAVRLHFKAMK